MTVFKKIGVAEIIFSQHSSLSLFSSFFLSSLLRRASLTGIKKIEINNGGKKNPPTHGIINRQSFRQLSLEKEKMRYYIFAERNVT